MYVIIDDRESVTESYASGFNREGIASVGFWAGDFQEWLNCAAETDLSAVDAFLLGDCAERTALPGAIRKRSDAPIIAVNTVKSLAHTLDLFAAGVDDVVHVPVHVREVLVRSAVIQRRSVTRDAEESAIQVFCDGRDPIVAGAALSLPRRELRILEHLMSHRGKWLTKAQIFNAIYGVFDSDFDDSVVESHVSKLRKKLRSRLGRDPIQSRRYLGYRLGQAGADTSERHDA